MPFRLFVLLGGALGFLLTAGPVRAHALGAEARIRGNQVRVEAYYEDDPPAGAARVTVQDASRKVVAEGRTDEKGIWSFPRPAAGHYRLVVDAGAGHRKQLVLDIPVADVSPSEPSDQTALEQTPTVSVGPTREEFTRTPWLKIGLGLGAIGLLSAVLYGYRRCLGCRWVNTSGTSGPAA